MKEEDKKNMTLLIPIYNLDISNEIGGELKVGDITFISKNKIPYIRKRLGLKLKVSEYKKQMHTEFNIKFDPFDLSDCYAVVRKKISKKQSIEKEIRQIKEAIYILASSQFFRVKRYNYIRFGGPEYNKRFFDYFTVICSENGWWQLKPRIRGPGEPYRIDNAWKHYIKHYHFPNLLKILNGKLILKSKWKNLIKRAAILAGQSVFAQNIWEAYIFDMIAIDALLASSNDKYPDAIIERLVAFFGYWTDENIKPWKDVFERLYQLRCKYVHDGITGDLTIYDLISADTILANLLNTFVNMTKVIKCKEDILEFTDNYNAKKTLGLKIKRPKRIKFLPKNLSEYDKKHLKEMKLWWI